MMHIVTTDRLFDGTNRVAEKSYVAIDDDRIYDVGPIEALDGRFPASVPRV